MRILVIEDDELVASGIKQGLPLAGYTVDLVNSAEAGERCLQTEIFDLAVVDIGLPGIDGLTFIRRLRAQGNPLPVLVLSARARLEDTINGLDFGADDYMVKPFRLPELMARIRALIRRANSGMDAHLRHGPLVLDTATHTGSLAGESLDLTNREWAILEILLMASPNVVTKTRLLQALAGWEKDITPNTIEVHISRLRVKLLAGKVEIRTVRGIGYRMDPFLEG